MSHYLKDILYQYDAFHLLVETDDKTAFTEKVWDIVAGEDKLAKGVRLEVARSIPVKHESFMILKTNDNLKQVEKQFKKAKQKIELRPYRYTQDENRTVRFLAEDEPEKETRKNSFFIDEKPSQY